MLDSILTQITSVSPLVGIGLVLIGFFIAKGLSGKSRPNSTPISIQKDLTAKLYERMRDLDPSFHDVARRLKTEALKDTNTDFLSAIKESDIENFTALEPFEENTVSPGGPDDIPKDAEFTIQTVFFGTDRLKEGDTPSLKAYGTRRAHALTLGKTLITIPPKKVHKLGQLERPKAILFGTIQVQRERRDRHFTEYKTTELDAATLTLEASAIANTAKNYEKSAFVFIHGFNVTFENAMFRAAQMACDMNFDGPVFAYSWPAIGKLASYVTDMDSANLAALHLDDFLDMIAKTEGIERIHLVTHSMGNALLSHLMLRAGTKLQAQTDAILDQLILAAPDIDREVFASVAAHFVKAARGVTLYASSNDKALIMARAIRNQYPRAGDVPPDGPIVYTGIDTIDVSAVSTDLFGLNHSEYAEDRTVMDDIAALIKLGAAPCDRMPSLDRIELQDSTGSYYRIKD